uniref:PAX-interacting protein 1 n=1 Tax=Syphacia muris TaxID=451379 RepID=A0A0N5ANA8_9BILA
MPTVMYPAGGASNVQAQQYSPVARYQAPVQNAAVISPCYPQAGHDMRSPQLISPTQAQMVPSGVIQGAPATLVGSVGANGPPMQRNISTMELQAGTGSIQQQHMRMVSSAPYYGHEPNIAANALQDMCLIGCYIVVLENERFLIDQMDQRELTAVVQMHGGEIEYGVRAFAGVGADRITHVICETTSCPQVQTALEEQKRCVTLQWLNDVLAKKRLDPPWRVAHLPTCWGEKKPALNKIIAINGFDDTERSAVRMMINAIGARFTPYLTKHNHFLVTKGCEGERLERGRELNVTIVTYQWLVDLYIGKKTSLQENDDGGFYTNIGAIHEVNVAPYALELYSSEFKRLLEPWRHPVVFTNEQWQRAMELKRTVENDEKVFPNKKLRLSTPPPTVEQIEQHRAHCDKKDGCPVVCFSGFTQEEEDALSRVCGVVKISFLGALVTKNVGECTHLVVVNLWRTMKLLQGIALGKNIVSANWIIDGYRNGLIPDTIDYFVRDEDSEKSFGYDLKYSVLKARYRRVFQDVLFYLTPSVEPSFDELRLLIISAGGQVLQERPFPAFVVECIQKEIPLLLISNDSDVHLLQYLTDCGMPVFNVELVLTGILRQKLENSSKYRVAPIRTSQLAQLAASPNPPSVRNQLNTAQRVAS